MFHAGTLAGNPLATAAGLAALDQLDPDVYIELAARARHLAVAAARRLRGGRLPAPSSRSSARSSGWCAATVPRPVDFDGAKRTDEAAYAAFFQAMLAEGVAMAPGAYEAIFVGLGHDDAVLADLGERAHRGGRRRRVTHAVLTTAACRRGARAASSVAVVRQVLSWRFVATIGALVGLTALIYLAFGNNRSVAEVIEQEGPRGPPHRPRRRSSSARPARASPCRAA